MPRSLSEAAAFLKKSQKAMEYFGSDFVYILSDLINFDVAMYHKTVTKWEWERYLENS
jgi:glutamine synthetase